MTDLKEISGSASPVHSCADDAVGVPEGKWYIAIVNNRSEKKDAQRLTDLGIENYVPVQKVYRTWRNGRRAKVDHVVIPSVVFIRCTEGERRKIVKLPYIFRFMTNRASGNSSSTARPVAIVPDKEIEKLKFMLGQSDTPVFMTDAPYKKGDLVQVVRGSLAGLVGEVTETKSGKSVLTIRLENLGCASLTIDSSSIQPTK